MANRDLQFLSRAAGTQSQPRPWTVFACHTLRTALVIPVAGSIAFWLTSLTGAILAFPQPGNAETIPLFRVHIVSSLHENVAKAKIEVSSGRASQTAFTDADGTANFANLSSGNYKIRIEAFTFKIWTGKEDIATEQERPLLVTLQPGVLGCEPPDQIEYNNKPGPPVQGMVVDSISRHGLRGMRIEWRRPGEKNPMLTVRSMKKGFFEVSNIPPGRYLVRVTDEDYTELDKIHQDVETDVVVPRQDSLFITVKLSRKGYVEICS